MFKTKDAWLLLQQHPSNMVLATLVLTVLLPASVSFPTYISLGFIIPHLTYITLFTLSILIGLKAIFTKT